jgi:hypothetical protein
MGPSSYIDSFNNPKDYVLLNQDQLIGNAPEFSEFTAIIKKHLETNFSTNPRETIYVQSTRGYYTLHSQMNQSGNVNKTDTFSGKVISFIPTNPFTTLSCLWWQKTNQLIQTMKR